MFARLSVDTGPLRDYGAACAAHATDLDIAAERLNAVAAGSQAMFGSVGTQFIAALTRAAAREATTIARLSASVAAGTAAAIGSAASYDGADDDAAVRIAGTC